MPRILAVDDSRAIRSMVGKQVLELGFEVDEAEHGEEGFAKLEEIAYDLVLLDVTMPVLDGPGMLAKMREHGNKTPVVMLTSESKRSVVASVMKLGIEDYILKPFKPEELKAKILKVLKTEAKPAIVSGSSAPAPVAAASVEAAAQAPAPAHSATAAFREMNSKAFIDVLVVDDMENVHRKLKALFPAHVTLLGCVSASSALAACREKVFRVILLDTEIPDVSTSVLLSQLRALQPNATCLALCLRTANDAEKELCEQGFDGVLFKPFDQGSIEDFLVRHFDNQELLQCEENVAHVSGYQGREDRIEKYYKRVEELSEKVLAKIAAACFDEVVVDMEKVPARPDRTPKLVLALDRGARKLGMELRLSGTKEVEAVLKGFTETASVPFFANVDAARRGVR